MAITLRNTKGSPLTNTELDENFSYLEKGVYSAITNGILHRSPTPINSVFIYDTSKDSDGGAWTEKCQNTSWYNETLNGNWLGACASESAARAITGATTGDYFQLTTDGKFYKLNATSGTTEVFRGRRAKFPRIAAIVAEGNNHTGSGSNTNVSAIVIYDLTEPNRPMWMKFIYYNSGSILWQWGATKGMFACQGQLYCWSDTDQSGLLAINFILDNAYKKSNNTGYSGNFYGNISQRNSAIYYNVNSSASLISGPYCNQVTAAVLPNTPIDLKTGLPNPTIAMATSSGVSLIRYDGGVINSSVGASTQIILTPQVLLVGKSDAAWYYVYNPNSLSNSFSLSSITASTNELARVAGNRQVNSNKYSLVRSSGGTNFQQIKHYESFPTKSLVSTITDTYNTGWMPGDIRRCLIAGSSAQTIVGSVLNPSLFVNTYNTDSTLTVNGGQYTFTIGSAKASNSLGGLMIENPGTIANKTYRFSFKCVANNGGANVVALFAGDQNTRNGYWFYGNFVPGTTYTYYLSSSVNNQYSWGSYIGIMTQSNSFTISDVIFAAIDSEFSYKNAPPIVYGTVAQSLAATGNQLVAYSGFSAANYLREPYSSDLDFGTGEWSVSAWVNADKELYLATGANLISNGGPNFTATTGWSLYGCTASIVNGNLRVAYASDSSGYHPYPQVSGLTVGKAYKLEFEFVPVSGAVTTFSAVASEDGSGYVNPVWGKAKVTGTASVVFAATTSGATRLHLFRDGAVGTTIDIISVTLKEVTPSVLAERNYSSGASIKFGLTAESKVTATAYDGTTTRTATSSTAIPNTTWLHACATYRAGKLAILVNGVEVASTNGVPLLTLNNSNAVLTIGNSYALDAPFPGSIALLKISGTVPTSEQLAFIYEQEKLLFKDNAQCVLPDSGSIVDLAYDEVTDRWVAASASNKSFWSGLTRVSTEAVPSGSFNKLAVSSGIQLMSRLTTNPGVDITIPTYNRTEEPYKYSLVSTKNNQDIIVYDYDTISFTANTTNGSNSLTSVASIVGSPFIGMKITGTGIPTDTTIIGINGTTYYLSANATANGSTIAMGQADYQLPLGYTARVVYVAGTQKREGSSKDYTRLYDGFRETIRFGISPGASSWVQIHAVKDI